MLNDVKRLAGWFNENLGLVLLVASFYLFTSKSLYNISFALMAVPGMYRLWHDHDFMFKRRETRLFGLLFLGLWLPMLVSLTDAFVTFRSAQNVFPYLRFYFAGIYVLHEMLRGKRFLELAETAFFIIMLFWSLDGTLQFLTGRDIFGYPYAGGKFLTGPFYPDTTISHVLAGFSGLFFESLRRRSAGRPWIWLFILPLYIVIFAAGRRSVWFMLALNTIGFAAYHIVMARHRRRILAYLLAGTALIAVVFGAMFATQKTVQQRIYKTMGLFSTSTEKIDRALSHRLDIWEVAWHIYEDHWINGIGPRGFRFAYRDYARKGNYFYDTSQTHPHMMLLEILAESGTIGFAGYAFFLLLLWRNTRRYFHDKACFACFLTLFTAAFPINSHVAFYGAYWSSILWWMIIFMTMNVMKADMSKHAEGRTQSAPRDGAAA